LLGLPLNARTFINQPSHCVNELDMPLLFY
jgi:hypothetical protein